jgi:hypothetical protein
MVYYRITLTICCRNCKKISIPFVTTIIDEGVDANNSPLIDTSGSLTDHSCHYCGSKGQWWILNQYKEDNDPIQMKTVFTFEISGNQMLITNPINELGFPVFGEKLIDLARKELATRYNTFSKIDTLEGGQGIIMWAIADNNKPYLSIFNFENINYSVINTLIESLINLANENI